MAQKFLRRPSNEAGGIAVGGADTGFAIQSQEHLWGVTLHSSSLTKTVVVPAGAIITGMYALPHEDAPATAGSVTVDCTTSGQWEPSTERYTQGASDWAPIGVSPEATGTIVYVSGTAVVQPVYVDDPLTLTKASILVTAAGAAGKLVRVGLYRWSASTKLLGALVKDYGTLLCDATGIVSTAASSTVIGAGWYAWVTVADDTPTLRTVLGSQGAARIEPFTTSTTTLVATTHYTAASGFAAGTAMPSSGAAVALTRVTSTSEFRPTHAIIAQFTADVAMPAATATSVDTAPTRLTADASFTFTAASLVTDTAVRAGIRGIMPRIRT